MAAPFSPVEASTKIIVSLAIGFLVGLEREWAHKELGVRTFALASLLGALSWLISPATAIVALIGGVVLVALVNIHSYSTRHELELTTSVALLVTLVLGILVGQRQYFTAVASALLMTGLLAWKMELVRLAGDLKLEEIRGAVLLGLLAFVIYPVLPNRYVDPWQLFNPRQAWTVVVILAGLGFLNYVMLRVLRTRGLYLSAILGGLVNSTATVAQISRTIVDQESANADMVAASVLLAGGAMVLRNLVILLIFAAGSLRYAAVPMLAMMAVSLAAAWRLRGAARPLTKSLELGSPVSLPRVGALAALFIGIEIASTLAVRHFGQHGFLVVGFLGGMASSASTTAAAGVLARADRLTAQMAGAATVLASVASFLIHIPLIRRRGAGRKATFAVAQVTGFTLVIGVGLLAIWIYRF